jgi:hypothetical protein
VRWPFQSKKETDIRIFRDPKTDEITLRLVGPICLPSSKNPILTFTVTLDTKLDADGIKRLSEQLSYFTNSPRELESAE